LISLPVPPICRPVPRRFITVGRQFLFAKASPSAVSPRAFNAGTPFITPDPPWLSDVPVVFAVAEMAGLAS
jgi:hypothetical protein